MKNRLITTLLVLFSVSIAMPAWANADQAVIAELQAQVQALVARIEKLEGQADARAPLKPSPTTRADVTATTARGWADQLKITGDFRYRHETIDAENSATRNRHLIRARTELTAVLSDTLQVGFGLASSGDYPLSTNRTLGNSSSSKGVRLNLAYAKWTTPVQGLDATVGKMKSPFHRAAGNTLIWDSDLNPEGGALSYQNGSISITAAGLWLNEAAGDDDSFLFGTQLSWETAIRDCAQLNAGLSYYHFTNVEGEPIFFDEDPRGNSVDLMGNYLFGFRNVEAYAELTFNFADRPIMVYANYVRNLDAGEFDTGYAIGAKANFMHGSHPWQLAYTYQDLEADAVLGIIVDSDFIGGGTDGTGHIVRGSYSLSKKISLHGTLFVNERGHNLGMEEDYDRLQLDVSYRY